MKKHQLEKATISELVDIYVEAAIVHGQSTLTGDTKANHKAHDTIAGVYREF